MSAVFAPRSAAQLSNGTTGTGAIVLATAPTLAGTTNTAGLSLTGTGGASFVGIVPQASAPAAPASGLRAYADASGRLAWIRQSDGFTRTFDSTLTANRVWTMPDAATTVPIISQQLTISGPSAARTYTLPDYNSAFVHTLFAVKSADETVNNSASLQNDDHLSFAVGASETWCAELLLLYSSTSTTPKLKFDFTGPASPTVVSYHGETWGSFTANTGRKTAFSTAASMAGTMATSDVVAVHLVLVNGSNAGTVQLRWAQNTATAENTIIQRGSYLKAIRIA